VNQMAAAAASAASSLNQMDDAATAAAAAEEQAQRAWSASHDMFDPTVMGKGPQGAISSDPSSPSPGIHYKGGGLGQNLSPGDGKQIMIIAQAALAASTTPDMMANQYVSKGDYAGALIAIERMGEKGMSTVDTLTQQMNSMTKDPSAQAANLQAELAWLNSLPETLARDQQIVTLKQSIDSLTTATNANTAASLNPLYTQGAGALSIGYYHAANGLDGVAQGGTPGVDSVPIHIMAMPGEPIKVGAPAIAANSNSQPAQQAVQNVYMDMRGMDTNTARRSRRQVAQGFGQIAAAGR
jgi:hypothetical protein